MGNIAKFGLATATVTALLYAPPARAYDYMALGLGTMPCRYWLSTPQLEGEGGAWILGWWTGLNSRNDNHWVGSYTDGNGIIQLVKHQCQLEPDALLMTIVDGVFRKLARPSK